VWEIDDASKRGDPNYWWSADEVAQLRAVAPDGPDLTGKPRGESLASLRRRAVGDVVEWVFPPPRYALGASGTRVRVSLSPWQDADAERTYLVVQHRHTPTEEERRAVDRDGSGLPAELEDARRALRTALAVGNAEAAHDARQRWHELGKSRVVSRPPWNADRAVELQPGVYVLDERPAART
jgi:hypothetical protein